MAWILRGGELAKITIEKDIATTFSESIVENLNLMGFDTTAVNSSSANQGSSLLRVDIRGIEYKTYLENMTCDVHARGGIKATATRASRNYDQLYYVDDMKRAFWVEPDVNEISQMINATVSAVLQEMFNDTALFEFLSEQLTSKEQQIVN